MTFITDFADQAVVLPTALLVAVVLAMQGWRRGAVAWVLAVGGTLGLMLALKLACDWFMPGPALRSPSGHAAAAGALYGGLTALLTVRASPLRTAAIALAWVVLIAVTRLALGAHTVPEVVVGGLVGVAGAAGLRLAAGVRPPGLARAPLVLAAALVALAFHGHHVKLERSIHGVARSLGTAGRAMDAPWTEARSSLPAPLESVSTP